MPKEYVCTLDQASLKKAKEELNEDPKDRMAAVQALKDWILAQPYITVKEEDIDIHILLMILRGTKFSQIKAREKLVHSMLLRVDFPKMFVDLDSWHPSVKTIADAGYLTRLPKRTPEGCCLIVQKLGFLQKVDDLKLTREDLMRFPNVFFNPIVRDEMTQVNGLVFIVDFTGLTLSGITKLMDKEQGKIQKEMQKGWVGRFKAFHYYRPGVLLETLLAFWKPFMPKKWISRIKVHDTMESLYKDIPMDCLPVEFLPDDYKGPNVGTLDEITKANLSEITTEEYRNRLLKETGKDIFVVDKSKMPQEQVTEHFRKLNVD